MAQGRRRKGLWFGGAIIAVLAAAAVWIIWSSASEEAGAAGSLKPAALCAACGYYVEGSALQLVGDGGARAPVYGPGYECPKCGKKTLYVNPFICGKCKTPFLLSEDAAGKVVAKCPECGWTP
ncbi:MAG: hypothetical protein ACUVXJ_12640 [Phycisphaerae bacterium]